MKLARRSFTLSLLALLLVLVSAGAPALAQESSAGEPAESPIGTLFRWLNFALVFGGGGYLIARKGSAYFRRRAAAIAASISEAATAKAQAQRELAEAEERLHALDQEIAQLRAAAHRESAAEARRLRDITREEIEKISRAASAEVEAARRAARRELKALAARLAVERAGALLRERMTPEARASLFRGFLGDLTRSVN